MKVSFDENDDSSSWRDQALSRSLAPARARSDARLQRLIDAARDMIRESPDSDFTVAEVATRSGISLKTLYRWFPSKDVLLLALLEEECQMGAPMLVQAVDPSHLPAERLKRCVEAVFELAETAPDYARVIYRQHQRLSIDHGVELAAAVAPMVQIVENEIRSANEEGIADPGDPAKAAEIVFSLLVHGLAAFTSAPRADPESVASLWRFIAGGLGLRSEATSAREELHAE
jgi:AcrR family transcriptional regulator